MGATTTFTKQYTSSISPSRMFKALIVDSSNLIPQLLPQFIESIDVIRDHNGSGKTIEQVNFTTGSNMKCVKNRIDELDEEGLVCKYTMIEGEPLGERIKSIAYEVKFGSGEGEEGCVCTVTSHYNAVGEYGIEEEEIEEGREKGMKIFGVVEAYLLENPLLYN
ncbi:Pathogenesis-related protein STH-2 [Linum perenne]